MLGKTVVFVASAALTEEVCDEKRFRKLVSGPIKEIRYAVHDSLFTAYDEEESWGIHHRIIAPQLSPQAVADHFTETLACTNELIAKWAELSDSGNNKIHPLPDLNRLNLEATTLTLFGKKLNCIDAPRPHPMLAGMEDSTSEAIQRPTRPKILNWLLHDAKFKRATAAMRKDYAADIVAYRNEHPELNNRRDLLWTLMNGADPASGKSLTPEQVIDEIVCMPIGSSTAPCAITSAIYYMTQFPNVVQTAREELDSVLGLPGLGQPITHETISQLPYLQALVKETLRMSNAAPGFNIEPIPRENKKDTTPILLGGGKYQIAHNQALIVVLAGVNRDPAIFESPNEFKPERWLDQDKVEKMPSAVKKWFGNGKRECIGKHWAWEFLCVVLAKLLHEVDFEQATPEGWELKTDGWFNVRPIDFEARVRMRVVV